VEALARFRVALPHPPTQAQIIRFATRIKHHFPNPRKAPRRAPRALSLINEERTQAVRLRGNDFIFSHLKPYSNWESLRASAAEFWPVYVDVFKPHLVTQLGLHYINLIEMPGGPDTFRSMLTATFTTPPEMLPHFQTNLSQMIFRDEDSAARAMVLTVTSPPDNAENKWSVLLSIGADEDRLQFEVNDYNQIFLVLEKLRSLKNELFFAVTTEEAKRTFR